MHAISRASSGEAKPVPQHSPVCTVIMCWKNISCAPLSAQLRSPHFESRVGYVLLVPLFVACVGGGSGALDLSPHICRPIVSHLPETGDEDCRRPRRLAAPCGCARSRLRHCGAPHPIFDPWHPHAQLDIGCHFGTLGCVEHHCECGGVPQLTPCKVSQWSPQTATWGCSGHFQL